MIKKTKKSDDQVKKPTKIVEKINEVSKQKTIITEGSMSLGEPFPTNTLYINPGKEKISFEEVIEAKEDKMDILFNKLDRVIELLENPVNVKQTKLSEMSLSDLNYLKEMLARNITMNNYPGGDIDIKVKSNDLIIKITSHINNKISLYE